MENSPPEIGYVICRFDEPGEFRIIAQASRNKGEVLVADLDFDMILEVRQVWQFFRDRHPESYGPLTARPDDLRPLTKDGSLHSRQDFHDRPPRVAAFSNRIQSSLQP
jgi:hypothetical protein